MSRSAAAALRVHTRGKNGHQRPRAPAGVVALAVGIGANGAIFSVVNGILLKPLRYAHPEALVAVDHSAPGVNLKSAGAAPFLYFTYREQAKTFQDVGLWRSDTDSVTGVGDPEEIRTVDVSDGVLPMLGVKPLLGRLFTRADDAPGGAATMILSYGYWRSRFGADPSTIGRRVLVNGKPREMIGVLPETFRFLGWKHLDRSGLLNEGWPPSASCSASPARRCSRA